MSVPASHRDIAWHIGRSGAGGVRVDAADFLRRVAAKHKGAQGSGARAAEARPRRPTPTASSRTGSHVWTVMDELREARSERDALREEASVLRDSNKQLAAKLSGTSMLLENLKRRHETTQTRARELEDEVEASHEDARRQEAAHEAAVAELDARLADTRREVEEARQALAAEQQARAQDQQAAAAQADELRRALEQEAAVGREEYSLLEKAAQSGDAKDARIAELKEEVAAMRSSLMQARANALHRTLSQVRAASQQAQEKMQRRLAKAQAELAARDASLKEAQSERDAALRQVRDLGQAQLPEGDLLEQVQRMQRAVEADCHCTPTRGGHHRANGLLSPLAAATAAAGDAHSAIELASKVQRSEAGLGTDELRRLLSHLVPLLRSMVGRLVGHVRDMQVMQHAFLARAPAEGGAEHSGPQADMLNKLRAVLERVTQERNALLEYAQHLEQAREAGQSRHVAPRSDGDVDNAQPSAPTLQELASSVDS